MRRLLLVLFAAVSVAATAYAAPPDNGRFRGRTSQHLNVTVVVKDGRVDLVNTPWRTRNCKPRDGYRMGFDNWYFADIARSPIEQTPTLDSFSDGGNPVVVKNNRTRYVVRSRVAGHFVGDDEIRGTLRVRARSRGRYGFHRCTQRVRWSAKLVGR